MDQIAIGRYIARKRKEQNLTQEQLSEQLGVSNKTISKWENGKCIADGRCLGFSHLEFFSQSRYASMVMIPAAHLSFSFRASAAHRKNCSCVHLPAAMCAKRFLYSRRYAENTSSLFFLSAHTFDAPTILHGLPLGPNGRSQ